MRKAVPFALAAGIALGGLAMALSAGGPSTVSAQFPQGPSQSDHALFDATEHVHCGVRGRAESYTLHVAATAGTSPGTLSIKFGDASTLTFNIPANSSFSTTQELGGVPRVDDVVKIQPSGGVTGGMASVKARAGVQDPFTGDGELDNFCLTHPGDPGVAPFE